MSQVETPPAAKPQSPETQTIEASLGQLRAHRTRHGTMIAPPQDAYVGHSLELYGEYCKAESDALVQLIKPGNSVVEVGSNIGSHTVALARACAPGPLYAFEPQQRLFQMMCANLVLNGVRNAVVSSDALGATEGAALLPMLDYGGKNNFGGVSLQTATKQEGPYSVRVRTLDSFGLKSCHLLKVDVEGWEADVIRGAADTIARYRPILYVENDREARQRELVELIDSLDYDQYWHTPLLFHPNNFNGVKQDVFPGVASANMFCTPREKAVNVRGLNKIDPKDIRPPLRIPERKKGPRQP